MYCSGTIKYWYSSYVTYVFQFEQLTVIVCCEINIFLTVCIKSVFCIQCVLLHSVCTVLFTCIWKFERVHAERGS